MTGGPFDAIIRQMGPGTAEQKAGRPEKESGMIIRPMKIEDYDKVYALWESCKGMGLSSADDSREGIEKYLKRNPHTCFVAEEDGVLIGAILGGHDGRRGHISHAAVRQDLRRQGIGRALIDAVLEAMKAEGIVKVNFVVFKRNEEGNAFWEHLGFAAREDLVYRDKVLIAYERKDT